MFCNLLCGKRLENKWCSKSVRKYNLNFQNRVALTEIKFEKSPYLDECGYSFVIMAKGMAAFISELILENRGTFENKRSCDMNAYGVYGKTVQRALVEGDEKKRYIHIYHSISKEADERETFENALRERTALLMSHQNETIEFG